MGFVVYKQTIITEQKKSRVSHFIFHHLSFAAFFQRTLFVNMRVHIKNKIKDTIQPV